MKLARRVVLCVDLDTSCQYFDTSSAKKISCGEGVGQVEYRLRMCITKCTKWWEGVNTLSLVHRRDLLLALTVSTYRRQSRFTLDWINLPAAITCLWEQYTQPTKSRTFVLKTVERVLCLALTLIDLQLAPSLSPSHSGSNGFSSGEFWDSNNSHTTHANEMHLHQLTLASQVDRESTPLVKATTKTFSCIPIEKETEITMAFQAANSETRTTPILPTPTRCTCTSSLWQAKSTGSRHLWWKRRLKHFYVFR